jgi:hypothetical protein
MKQHPTDDELAEARDRLGWETPIEPSADAYEAVRRENPRASRGDLSNAEAADFYRLAQTEEMLIRWRQDAAGRN